MREITMTLLTIDKVELDRNCYEIMRNYCTDPIIDFLEVDVEDMRDSIENYLKYELFPYALRINSKIDFAEHRIFFQVYHSPFTKKKTVPAIITALYEV
jgi:hypothetical protein